MAYWKVQVARRLAGHRYFASEMAADPVERAVMKAIVWMLNSVQAYRENHFVASYLNHGAYCHPGLL